MSAEFKSSPHVNGGDFDAESQLDPKKALVPETVRVNERRVARGFWPKIRKVAAKVPFARDALSVWYCAADPQTPAAAKGMIMAALAYFVLPTDAVPDFLGVIGFTDDAAVFAALMALVGRHLKDRHRESADELLEKLRAD
jgi:uncharacterized membrane protein YkvA (DUF1232 family)